MKTTGNPTTATQLGMIGLGRMGANMVRRLRRAGIDCVVHDRDPAPMRALAAEGATAAETLEALVAALRPPRSIWIMIPSALVDGIAERLAPLLAPGDALVDGGNSNWQDAIRRSRELRSRGVDHVDVGVSGGVWGLERGYCLMVGGPDAAVARLEAIFSALAPGHDAAPPTPGAERFGTAASGWLHCGGAGAGHFVKMVHNGIEYGMMCAYAEGLNLLRRADAGARVGTPDAETTPLREPDHYRYDFDVAAIAELWRRGSVIGSWLLDLTARALAEDPGLARFAGRVSDSGEGRWTVHAAVDTGTPIPVLAASLFQRFESRGAGVFAGQVLSAMREQFGGHAEKAR